MGLKRDKGNNIFRPDWDKGFENRRTHHSGYSPIYVSKPSIGIYRPNAWFTKLALLLQYRVNRSGKEK